jgi:ribosomal protein L19
MVFGVPKDSIPNVPSCDMAQGQSSLSGNGGSETYDTWAGIIITRRCRQTAITVYVREQSHDQAVRHG